LAKDGQQSSALAFFRTPSWATLEKENQETKEHVKPTYLTASSNGCKQTF
jgi:hypothetical protein